MNIDKTIATLEEGFKNPETVIKRIPIEDAKMPEYGLRRKVKGTTHHWVWMISVGEQGQQPLAWFLDHKLNGALKKGLSWRGIQPKTRGNGATENVAHK